MVDFPAVADEIFQTLRSYNNEVMMYDTEGNSVYEPMTANRFFIKKRDILVSMSDANEDSSISMLVGKRTDIADILGMVQAFRLLATKFNLLFNLRGNGESINPRSFVNNGIKESASMYGTSKSSYLKFPHSRMIVRHNNKVEEKVGARSRNISHIFIENSVGERFMFPTKQILPARAMAHHVSNGGSFTDNLGQQIIEMAEDYQRLAQCSRYINSHSDVLAEDCLDIKEACKNKMRKTRKVFEKIYRSVSGYEVERDRCENLCEENINNDAIEEMKTKLQIEGLELDEMVIKSAAKALSENVLAEKLVPEITTVNVCGKAVSSTAWNDFKAGKLDFMHYPKGSSEMSPTNMNKTSALIHHLGELVPQVQDDSMANLLSFVAEQLPEETNPKMLKNLRVIAMQALKCANIQWENNSLPETVMNEMNDALNVDLDEKFKVNSMGDISQFDPEDFIYYGCLKDEDFETDSVSRSYVISCLKTYLAKNFNVPSMLMSKSVMEVLPKVTSYLTNLDMSLTESDQLSQEDILYPKDKSLDLKKDVITRDKEPLTETNGWMDDSHAQQWLTDHASKDDVIPGAAHVGNYRGMTGHDWEIYNRKELNDYIRHHDTATEDDVVLDEEDDDGISKSRTYLCYSSPTSLSSSDNEIEVFSLEMAVNHFEWDLNKEHFVDGPDHIEFIDDDKKAKLVYGNIVYVVVRKGVKPTSEDFIHEAMIDEEDDYTNSYECWQSPYDVYSSEPVTASSLDDAVNHFIDFLRAEYDEIAYRSESVDDENKGTIICDNKVFIVIGTNSTPPTIEDFDILPDDEIINDVLDEEDILPNDLELDDTIYDPYDDIYGDEEDPMDDLSTDVGYNTKMSTSPLMYESKSNKNSNLTEWVNSYKEFLKDGNQALARQVKRNIDLEIDRLKLNPKDFY